jgi:hypothetical protein
MEFMTSPSDLLRVAEAARQIDSNPLALAGRLIGLGADEQKQGIPGWAVGALLFGLGVWAGVRYGPEIRKRIARI